MEEELITADLKQLIQEGVEMLPPSSKARNSFEIERKAARFLVLKAQIADAVWALERKSLEANAVEKADYARAMDEIDVKTIAEKQLRAAADPDYIQKKKEVAELKVALEWLGTYDVIFTNAHIFYRQQMKQEQGEF